jgi:hypothetical protein
MYRATDVFLIELTSEERQIVKCLPGLDETVKDEVTGTIDTEMVLSFDELKHLLDRVLANWNPYLDKLTVDLLSLVYMND